jgi:hypothetical protein
MLASSPRGRQSPRIVHLVVVSVVLALVATTIAEIRQKAPDFDQACRDGQPYFVASSLRGQASSGRAPDPRAASVLLFRDTARNEPQYVVATQREIGAIWGLAYRRGEPALYMSAYHKRGVPYGPDGPGAVYRFDLATGEVEPFVTVPDAGDQRRGPDAPDGKRDADLDSARDVGLTALGDIDLSEDESELYVMNLADRRIYRYEMPSGRLLGSFDNGGSGETWAADARPFALAVRDGFVFHGVVNARGVGDDFRAVIYRSAPDGADLTTVATLDLRYKREGVRLRRAQGATSWSPWQGGAPSMVEPSRPMATPPPSPPQPMLTDLAFADDGTMVVGLRDRRWDMAVQWIKEENVTYGPTVVSAHNPSPTPTPAAPQILSEVALGFGDILAGHPDADKWNIQTSPEFFVDSNALGHAESALGALAAVPGTNTVAGTAFGVAEARSDAAIGEEGVYWFDVKTGNKTGLESLGRPWAARPYADLLRGRDVVQAHCTMEIYLDFSYYRDVGTLGDLEVLCGRPENVPTPSVTPTGAQVPSPTPTVPVTEPPPSPTPTDTLPPPTPTDTPVVPTLTPVPPSPTPTPKPGPIYLPILLREAPCKVEWTYGDVALVFDLSTTMRLTTASDQPKIDAVLRAARYFVGLMEFDPQPGGKYDQVAVAGFNDTAWVQLPLGHDRQAVERALSELPGRIAEGTRLDLAFQVGAAALPAERRLAGNLPVMIVLTDGLPNQVPPAGDGTMETTVLQAAAAAKAEGIRVYTIGVGSTDPSAPPLERIDPVLLAACASEVDYFFHEPSADQLDRVYGEIIGKIDECRTKAYWGRH